MTKTNDESLKHVISKTLSANDTGETGGHQAGILVPKKPEILGFFPILDSAVKNPRKSMAFIDADSNKWSFSFIYYNNKFFGGTRNEYRLTCMTPFLKQNGLLQGDEVLFTKHSNGSLTVEYKRKNISNSGNTKMLKLGSQWKVIKI